MRFEEFTSSNLEVNWKKANKLFQGAEYIE